MSKRPSSSRSANRRKKPVAHRAEASKSTEVADSMSAGGGGTPRFRQRVALAIAAGALAAWLTLLAIVAFAT